jgi:hypothetical protein
MLESAFLGILNVSFVGVGVFHDAGLVVLRQWWKEGITDAASWIYTNCGVVALTLTLTVSTFCSHIFSAYSCLMLFRGLRSGVSRFDWSINLRWKLYLDLFVEISSTGV